MSDLDRESPQPPSPEAGQGTSADEHEVRIVPLGETPPASTPPTGTGGARRRLSLRVGAGLSLLLLALLVLVLALPRFNNGQSVVHLGATTSPGPTGAASRTSFQVAYFYFGVDVPWTRVFLDSHLIPVPRVGLDPPFLLYPGQHIIFWHAPPFLQRYCTISVPASPDDTCVYARNLSFTPSRGGRAVRLLLLRETLSTMPLTQRTLLSKSVQGALQSLEVGETIQPGETYMSSRGPQVATQPLRATLRLRWNFSLAPTRDPGCQLNAGSTATSPCSINGQSCLGLCSVQSWQFLDDPRWSGPYAIWYAVIVVHAGWDIATSDGRLLASDVPAGGAGQGEQPLLLDFYWQETNWEIDVFAGPNAVHPVIVNGSPLLYNPACFGVQNVFAALPQNIAQVRLSAGPNDAAGCLITAIDRSSGQTTLYLYRLGSLLLVHNPALRGQGHPAYPLTDEYEWKLAQQLQQQPSQLLNIA